MECTDARHDHDAAGVRFTLDFGAPRAGCRLEWQLGCLRRFLLSMPKRIFAMALPNDCFGSGADERRHHQEGLLLEVKRTKSAQKRTLALKVGLSPEFGAHVPGCTEDAQTSAVAGSGVFGHPGTRAPLAGCGTSLHFPSFSPLRARNSEKPGVINRGPEVDFFRKFTRRV